MTHNDTELSITGLREGYEEGEDSGGSGSFMAAGYEGGAAAASFDDINPDDMEMNDVRVAMIGE